MKKLFLIIILFISGCIYSQSYPKATKPIGNYNVGSGSWSVLVDKEYIEIVSPVSFSNGFASELNISYSNQYSSYSIMLIIKETSLCGKKIADKSYRDIEAYTDDYSSLFFQNSDSRVYSNAIYFFLKSYDNVPYGYSFKNQGRFDYFKEKLLSNNKVKFKIPHIAKLSDEWGLPKDNPASSSSTFCDIEISLKGIKNAFKAANLIQ